VGSGYALVASTDSKSGRDAVDIYDSTNKLVAFHLLLSPGHRAVRAAGVTTLPTHISDGSVRGGRSSAVVLTSGGALVTFTEKLTEEKISLLVQKNLYSAAIVVAYADPSYEASDITTLYQRYAEHLYRKGDFSGAIDQYMHTIGSLESSHVIFRYLDAPKIPLLVKYLEKLRSRELATPVHNELLRTCYLKLNDMQAAEAITVSASWSVNDASLESIVSNLSSKPKDALATICSLEAHQATEVLVIHGASLARVLPRETAGVVISLCVGTYTPKALADASMAETLGEAAATTTEAAMDLKKMVSTNDNPKAMAIAPYPVYLFASAFVEHPKILRLLLAHCNRNKCHLTPSLRRTLLELTLAEWNHAKRSGDTEAEKLRHKEAVAVSDSRVLPAAVGSCR
jgi:vacuolar protein sorting-associated protein 11